MWEMNAHGDILVHTMISREREREGYANYFIANISKISSRVGKNVMKNVSVNQLTEPKS